MSSAKRPPTAGIVGVSADDLSSMLDGILLSEAGAPARPERTAKAPPAPGEPLPDRYTLDELLSGLPPMADPEGEQALLLSELAPPEETAEGGWTEAPELEAEPPPAAEERPEAEPPPPPTPTEALQQADDGAAMAAMTAIAEAIAAAEEEPGETVEPPEEEEEEDVLDLTEDMIVPAEEPVQEASPAEAVDEEPPVAVEEEKTTAPEPEPSPLATAERTLAAWGALPAGEDTPPPVDQEPPVVVAEEEEETAAPEPEPSPGTAASTQPSAGAAVMVERILAAWGVRPVGDHTLPADAGALALLLSDPPPADDFAALDALEACWPRGTQDCGSRALLAAALNLARTFGLPDKLPMASARAWRMLSPDVFQTELAGQLARIGDFIARWQKTQSTFLILEFGEIELIETLFEVLDPAEHMELLAGVMNFKVLSNRRLGLLRRVPTRLKRQVAPLLPARRDDALVLLARSKALLHRIAEPTGFAPIVETATRMEEELDKMLKAVAAIGAPPPPAGQSGGVPLGRIG